MANNTHSSFFSSGPSKKRPGWNTDVLKNAVLGRSHRSKPALEKIHFAINSVREILKIPNDYKIGFIPGSGTGALETALWSMLGTRGVDILSWDIFSQLWAFDVVHQLKIKDVRLFNKKEYSELYEIDFNRDVVFVWTGTPLGISVPDGNWISKNGTGLTICDASSAAFMVDLPWESLDATVFSMQKALGAESNQGIMVLSPKAVEHINNYSPSWPIPRLFRLKNKEVFNDGIFNGMTINTISMLCVEDFIDALNWANSIGGLKELIKKSNNNYAVIDTWIKKQNNFTYLVSDERIRSKVPVCLDFIQPMEENIKKEKCAKIALILEKEHKVFDVLGHTLAPPHIRLWTGPTIECDEILNALNCLDNIMRVI